VGLHGNDLLLNLHQQQLRFGQRQTQIGDVAKSSGRLIAITSKPEIDRQSPSRSTHRPFHPRAPTGHHTRPVVSFCL
jgi:hypothetical protein